ncbi:MAG: DMT family transporter [Anaerolineae bacterium]|nr:DMT family transporter [Anaerolineae bacterium]
MDSSGMWRGALYGITAASIWGSMYVVSDLVLLIVPPFTLLTLRIALGLAVLLPLSLRRGQSLPGRRSLRSLLAVGVVGLGISLGAQFLGTDLSTAVNGALVTSASPAFVVLFAVLLLRERMTLQRLAAIVLASAGLLIILNPASADFASDTFTGDAFLAVAAVTWGLYSVLVRRVTLRQATPALMVTIVALLGGLLVSIPASILELSQRPIGAMSVEIVLGILYLGIVSTALALLLWNRAFSLVPATIASLFFFAQPLAGALLAAVFLGQRMTETLWLGGILIALGVLLSLYRAQSEAANS